MILIREGRSASGKIEDEDQDMQRWRKGMHEQEVSFSCSCEGVKHLFEGAVKECNRRRQEQRTSGQEVGFDQATFVQCGAGMQVVDKKHEDRSRSNSSDKTQMPESKTCHTVLIRVRGARDMLDEGEDASYGRQWDNMHKRQDMTRPLGRNSRLYIGQ